MNHTAESPNTYVATCAVLLLLTLVTWEVAHFDLGRWNLLVALGIAFAKATLIASFFMQLRRSSSRSRLALIGGIFWLGILMLLTLADYLTRQQV